MTQLRDVDHFLGFAVLYHRGFLQRVIRRHMVKSEQLALIARIERSIFQNAAIKAERSLRFLGRLNPIIGLVADLRCFLDIEQLVTSLFAFFYPNLTIFFVKTVARNGIGYLVVIWLDLLYKPQLIKSFGIHFLSNDPGVNSSFFDHECLFELLADDDIELPLLKMVDLLHRHLRNN